MSVSLRSISPRKLTFARACYEQDGISQEMRSLIRLLKGIESPEKRLKELPDKFVQTEDTTASLVQDQLGVTTALVIHCAAHKRFFEMWGDSLVMDWTRSANYLGYHLGKCEMCCDGVWTAAYL